MKMNKVVVALTVLAFPMLLWAQDAAPVKTYTPETMSLWDMLRAGGWVLVPLVLLSFFGFAMVVYFFLTMRRDKIVDPDFVEGCRRLLRDKRLDRIEALCSTSGRPVAAVLRSAMDARATHGVTDALAVREAAEAEGERQAAALWDKIHYLMDIVVVAPMIGLLGTVFGMIQSFSGLALDISAAKPILLAHGVAQALTSTAMGLCVAIPAAMFYSFFRGHVNKLTLDMESASTDLVNRLVAADAASKQKPDVQV